MTGATDGAAPTADGQAQPPLIVARRLEVGYEGRAILPPIDVEIGRGQFWAILGPNGAGKSTFVRTLLGLERPVGGILGRAGDCRPCYVPQQATLDPIFPIRVLEFVLMGRLKAGRLWGPIADADRAAAEAALGEVKARDLGRKLLRDLSGGQRQRVLLARALAAEANLYFLDEPTAALDITTEQEVLALIAALRDRRGAGIVMITHLVEDGLERADHALLLDRDHAVALAGSARAIADAPELQRLYGPLGRRRELDHPQHAQGDPTP